MRRIKRPGRAALLILGLLFLRGLIPAGFMLAPVDGTLAIVLCDLDLPASRHHMHMADHAGHQHGAHGDSSCPYAQSAGPAPLPTLPVPAGATAFAQPQVPAARTQTLLGFGPVRQPSSRGPPPLA